MNRSIARNMMASSQTSLNVHYRGLLPNYVFDDAVSHLLKRFQDLRLPGPSSMLFIPFIIPCGGW